MVPSPPVASTACVLIVEDEPLVRSLVVQALEDAGYRVVETGDAQGALAALGEDPAIALMLTDLGLPRVSGRRLAEAAAILRPGLKVMFMTGYNDAGEAPPEAELIRKPFALADLVERVAALIG